LPAAFGACSSERRADLQRCAERDAATLLSSQPSRAYSLALPSTTLSPPPARPARSQRQPRRRREAGGARGARRLIGGGCVGAAPRAACNTAEPCCLAWEMGSACRPAAPMCAAMFPPGCTASSASFIRARAAQAGPLRTKRCRPPADGLAKGVWLAPCVPADAVVVCWRGHLEARCLHGARSVCNG
jgi:hypothetical protein